MTEAPRKSRRSRVTTSLQYQLDLLTQDRGVYREDLRILLKKELADLRNFWELNPGDDISKLRIKISDRLDRHFEAISPRSPRAKGERRQKLRRAYDLSFNIHSPPNVQNLDKKGDRQRLIEQPDSRYGRVTSSFETARADLLFLYAEIEQQILSTGFKPQVKMPVFGTSFEGAADANDVYAKSIAQEPKASDSPAAELPPQSSIKGRPKKRRRLIALVATGVLAVAAGIVVPIVISHGDDQPENYISIQNSPVDYKAGQTSSPDLVIPRPIAEIERPPTPDSPEFDAWKTKYGAVRANTMNITFIARGKGSEPNIIEAATVELVRREAPLTGTWIAPDGGSQGPDRQLFANLDQAPVKLTTDGTWQFPLLVSNTDPEIFTVTARTSTCHCYWRVVLQVNLPSGEATKVVVDNNGKPFEITSSAAAGDKTYLPYGPTDAWPRPIS